MSHVISQKKDATSSFVPDSPREWQILSLWLQDHGSDEVDADAFLSPQSALIGHALAQVDLGAQDDGLFGRGKQAVQHLDVSATGTVKMHILLDPADDGGHGGGGHLGVTKHCRGQAEAAETDHTKGLWDLDIMRNESAGRWE